MEERYQLSTILPQSLKELYEALRLMLRIDLQQKVIKTAHKLGHLGITKTFIVIMIGEVDTLK